MGRYYQKPTLLSNFSSISVGTDHSIALSYEGEVYSVGMNANGQLGTNSILPSQYYKKIDSIPLIKQISAGNFYTIITTIGGSVFAFGDGSYGKLGTNSNLPSLLPVELANLNNITHAAAGTHHTLFLDAFGEVFGSGLNSVNFEFILTTISMDNWALALQVQLYPQLSKLMHFKTLKKCQLELLFLLH